MYFLDASNYLWYYHSYNGNLLEQLFRIDEVVLLMSPYKIIVLINGKLYKTSNGKDPIPIDKIVENTKREFYMPTVYDNQSSVWNCYVAIDNNVKYRIYMDYNFESYKRYFDLNIDLNEYAIIRLKYSYKYDEPYTIWYIKKYGEIINSRIPIYSVHYCYSKQHSDRRYVQSSISDTFSVLAKGSFYEYIPYGYIRTDEEILKMRNYEYESYDAIYPNLFDSITRRGDEYFIDNVQINGDFSNFDFGQTAKSALTI